ncbi:MAG: ATP synthase F0 subunit B [Cyanobacteriota bacterium]
MTVNNVYKLLDKIEMLVIKGYPIPLTPWYVVPHEKIIDMLDKVRTSLPSEIAEATNVLKRRDEIQLESQRRANQMLTEAKEQAERLLSESELLKAVQEEAGRIRQQVLAEAEYIKKQAREEAEQIRAQAINEAMATREGSDQYAERVLTSLDSDLTDLHTIVRNGQKHLAKLKAESVANMANLHTQKSVSNNNSCSPSMRVHQNNTVNVGTN